MFANAVFLLDSHSVLSSLRKSHDNVDIMSNQIYLMYTVMIYPAQRVADCSRNITKYCFSSLNTSTLQN